MPVACESATRGITATVAVEITAQARIGYEVVRGVVVEVGYDSEVDDLSSVDRRGLSGKRYGCLCASPAGDQGIRCGLCHRRDRRLPAASGITSPRTLPLPRSSLAPWRRASTRPRSGAGRRPVGGEPGRLAQAPSRSLPPWPAGAGGWDAGVGVPEDGATPVRAPRVGG